LVSWADGDYCKRCGKPLPVAPPFSPAQSCEQQAAGDSHGSQDSHQNSSDAWNSYGARHPYGAPSKKRSGLAVASLVIGLIAVPTFGFLLVGAVAGIVLGVVALNKEHNNPAEYGGKGFAIGGIVASCFSVLLIPVLGICAANAIPNLLASRRAANEASAIGSLRTIVQAEASYRSAEGAGKFGSLSQLAAYHYIDPNLARGVKNGYGFALNVDDDWYVVSAMPLTPSHGYRSFYLSSEDGAIRVSAGGRPAGAGDPTLESFYETPTGSRRAGQPGARGFTQGPALLPSR
jgi:type II secretory pathway pseudopilin PulG